MKPGIVPHNHGHAFPMPRGKNDMAWHLIRAHGYQRSHERQMGELMRDMEQEHEFDHDEQRDREIGKGATL